MTMQLGEFIELASEALEIDLSEESPHRQLLSDPSQNLHIVAGPGTGKTSALALLALKSIFVDGFPTRAVFVTTFTRKAAQEISSRVTTGLRNMLKRTGQPLDAPDFDVSRIRIGTIDQLCENALVDHQLGVLADPLVQNETMTQTIFKTNIAGANTDEDFRMKVLGELDRLFGSGFTAHRLSSVRDNLERVNERIGQDQVDFNHWSDSGPGPTAIAESLAVYKNQLNADGRLDFISLEQTFRDELISGKLVNWLDPVRVVLVDEYQDTNALQESIYLEIASSAVTKGGWIALVGDDDQALFRFRGATVELFVDAPSRFETVIPCMQFETRTLNVNRRSSLPIVAFSNRYVSLDDGYQVARVPQKPTLSGSQKREEFAVSDQVPVLGLFRPQASDLAVDIAEMIYAILGDGFRVPGVADPIRQDQPGDIAIIGHSTQRKRGERVRFYGHLEEQLSSHTPAVPLFNPRGVQLHEQPSIQTLLGLALMCLDPEGSFTPEKIEREVRSRIELWRTSAKCYIDAEPEPNSPHGLQHFVAAWQALEPQRGVSWPARFPLMELVHELAIWLPDLREDPGIIYAEALTRTLASVSTFFGFSGALIEREKLESSVRRLYRRFFVPIARGEVDLDEQILESLPLESVNALTIHGAKGLEFPICFVDVGSDFRRSHRMQARDRFPTQDQTFAPYTLEDELRPFSLGSFPSADRPALDRAFDDIIRRTFVAATRAQHLLVLFGCGDVAKGPKPTVKNMGTGWTRGGANRWESLGVTLI